MPVKRITSVEEFCNLYDIWDKVLHSCPHDSIFLTIEWFLSWWDNLSEIHTLEVLVFFDDNNSPFGIAPLMRRAETLSLMASQDVTDYCDFIIAKGREKLFFSQLFRFIREVFPEIIRLELMNIRDSSTTRSILPGLASELGFIYNYRESEVAPLLSLPSTYEDYLGLLGRKCRHELRRKLRRMETLPDVKMERGIQPDDINNMIDVFIDLHLSSSPAKAEFWEKSGMMSFFKDVARRFAEKGWIVLDILRSGSDVTGVLISFTYLDEVHLYNVAYNQSYQRYSPGYFLFHEAIRQAIQQKKKTVDFLRGGEKYKYDFGAQDSKIWNLDIRLGEHRT